MTGLSDALSDSRFASLTDRSGSDDDGRGGGRLLALGGVALTFLSAATSLLAYGALPDRVRIRWTLGPGAYYGPEFAQTALVLAAFPVLVAAFALGAYPLGTALRREEKFAVAHPFYVTAVLGTLAVLLVAQVALVAANL